MKISRRWLQGAGKSASGQAEPAGCGGCGGAKVPWEWGVIGHFNQLDMMVESGIRRPLGGYGGGGGGYGSADGRGDDLGCGTQAGA